MENLKGKNLLIGKEPGRGRFLVALAGTGKSTAVGIDGSVPNSVSRCKPAENVAHAKITIDESGKMMLTNLKPQNVTYVNGKEIVSKRINHEDSIALGKDMYTVSLPLILDMARKISSGGETPPPPPEKVYNIIHLKKVYEDFEKEQEEIIKRQQEMNKKRMLPIMVGSFSGLASPILVALEFTSPLFFTIPIAAVSFGLYFVNFRKKDTSYEDRKAALEKFNDNYICPNSSCQKFFGNISYKLLKKQYNMQCPYCKSKFVEK